MIPVGFKHPRLLAIGGKNATSTLSSSEWWEEEEDTWEEGPDLPFGRSGLSSLMASQDLVCPETLASLLPHSCPAQRWASSPEEFSDNECPNLGEASANDLQDCKDACLGRQDCTAFNYNAVTTSCILRRCEFPVKAPTSDDHGGYDGFWLALDTEQMCNLEPGSHNQLSRGGDIRIMILCFNIVLFDDIILNPIQVTRFA